MIILSIVIPVYNVEAYLAECLDSVFNQLLDSCEVIAVNDGSTDNSRYILAEYQSKYHNL
jgi:glycosyltransferase involved in cell wall biosynthesis